MIPSLFPQQIAYSSSLVIGVFKTPGQKDNFSLSPWGQALDIATSGHISHLVESMKLNSDSNSVKTFPLETGGKLLPEYCTIVSGLIKQSPRETSQVQIDSSKNNSSVDNLISSVFQNSISSALNQLDSLKLDSVYIDDCGYPEQASLGAALSRFSLDYLKGSKRDSSKSNQLIHKKQFDSYFRASPESLADLSDLVANFQQIPLPDHEERWKKAQIIANGQNFARSLIDYPANIVTPQAFVDLVSCYIKENSSSPLTSEQRVLDQDSSITIAVRNENWLKNQKCGSLLSVSQGSAQKPFLLELHYRPNVSTPSQSGFPDVVLVGKGVTFDSGGLSLKPSNSMDTMKCDMAGAATAASVMSIISQLGLPLNVSALIPLVENMPSSTAIRPGDVVESCSGKTIEILNTDAEGRLILADALTQARSLIYHGTTGVSSSQTRIDIEKEDDIDVDRDLSKSPHPVIIDMATLTGAICVALGDSFTGLFANSDELANQLELSGEKTGQRMWRMPVTNLHHSAIRKKTIADIRNTSSVAGAGSSTAAAFLHEFVLPPKVDPSDTLNGYFSLADKDILVPEWAHLDIACSVKAKNNSSGGVESYNGGPVRALVDYLIQKSST